MEALELIIKQTPEEIMDEEFQEDYYEIMQYKQVTPMTYSERIKEIDNGKRNKIR